MSESKHKNTLWREVIDDFFLKKTEGEEEKYLKEKIKEIAKQYKKKNYYKNDGIKTFFDPKKNKKSDVTQTSLEFNRQKFIDMLNIEPKPDLFNEYKMKESYRERYSEISKKYAPRAWLTKASKDASSVSFATHVAKLTHSKIDTPSLYDQIPDQKEGRLVTTDLKEIIVDGAVTGNQFSPVFQFLELELEGKKLATIFSNEHNDVLSGFSQSSDELKLWNKGFSKALESPEVSSHLLAKQVYFPINMREFLSTRSYHLLCHMKSSSLAHAIFLTLNKSSQKEARIKREKQKYFALSADSFPEKAIIKVTASNHSNASQLNGKRGGRLQLFNCQPPAWQNQLTPPIRQKNMFYSRFMSRTYVNIDYLRHFLLRYQRIELSIKAPGKKKWIDRWVKQIIDEIMAYAISIQNLTPGWTQVNGIMLKPEHQYFLDPYRADETYQKARKSSDWQAAICADFAKWLNRKLVGKNKQFTPQPVHTRIWKELMAEELREHAQCLEWDIKEQKREAQR